MKNKHGIFKQPKDRQANRNRKGWCEVCKKVIDRNYADHMSTRHRLQGTKVYATDEQIKAWKEKARGKDTPTFGFAPLRESDEDESDAEEPNHSSHEDESMVQQQSETVGSTDFFSKCKFGTIKMWDKVDGEIVSESFSCRKEPYDFLDTLLPKGYDWKKGKHTPQDSDTDSDTIRKNAKRLRTEQIDSLTEYFKEEPETYILNARSETYGFPFPVKAGKKTQ